MGHAVVGLSQTSPYPHISSEQGEKGRGLVCVPPRALIRRWLPLGFLHYGGDLQNRQTQPGRLRRLSFCLVGLLSPEPSVAGGLPPPVLGAQPLLPRPQPGPVSSPSAPGCAPGHPRTAGPPHTCGPGCPSPTLTAPMPPLWVFSLVPRQSGPLARRTPTLRPDASPCIAPLPWAGRRVQTHLHGLQPPHRPRAQAENSTEANLTRGQQRPALCRSPSACRHHKEAGCLGW